MSVFLSKAQSTPNYTLSHYTDEDGLPQNSVKSIVADQLNYVWMASENGLIRYDGYQFVVFNKSNVGHMESNRFSHIQADQHKNIYAVTDVKEFIKIQEGKVVDSFNQVGHQLMKWTTGLGADPNSIWSISLPARFRHNWLELPSFVLPINKDLLVECFKNKLRFLHKNAALNKEVYFKSVNLTRFFLVGNEVYYFNENGSIVHINEDGIRTVLLEGAITKDPKYLQHKSEVVLFWNNVNNNLLFYFNKSFYTIKADAKGNLNTTLILYDFDINNKRIVSHYYDAKNERLFLGSDVNGLYILNKKKFMVLSENGKEDANIYYATIPYHENEILTAQGTVLSKGLNGTIVKTLRSGKIDNSRALLRDKTGCIWINEWALLYKCDSNLNILRKWTLPDEIGVFSESMDFALWVGLKNGGLYRLNIMDTAAKPSFELKIAAPTYIVSESANKLWIGTTKGLFQYDPFSHKLLKVPLLDNKYIRSLFVNKANEIWITTYDDGFYLLQANRITQLPNDKDAFLATAHCMVLDSNGYFWISTNKGLFQASRKDLLAYAEGKQKQVYYLYYGKENGFNTNEFNGGCQPCGLYLKSGQISLPSLDGLVFFDPNNITPELPNGKIVLDNISVDNVSLQLSDTILLPRVFERLKVNVSTAYMGNNRNVNMSYLFKSSDNKSNVWFPVSKSNEISFSSLRPGEYTLIVRLQNGFGADNYSEIKRLIIVPSHFYETIWFKIFMALVLILLIFIYIKIRLQVIKRNNRQLEIRIARRTQKLSQTLRALELSEQELRHQTQIQEMLIAAISHDIKSPIRYLLLSAQKMHHFIVNKKYDSLPVFNSGIQETTSKIYNTVDNLLNYISVQMKKGKVLSEEFDLYDLVEEKIKLFENIAAINNTVIVNNLNKQSIVLCNRALLAVVVHNLIDNAVKFTANGRITINSEHPDEFSYLTIEDTGTGLSDELIQWLNNNDKRNINIDTAEGHMGMGLVIVKELLFAIKSNLSVATNNDGGTIIKLTLKCAAKDSSNH